MTPKMPMPKAATTAPKTQAAKPRLPAPPPIAAKPAGCCRSVASWPVATALVIAVLLVSVFTLLNCYELGLMKGREQILARKVSDLQAQLVTMKASVAEAPAPEKTMDATMTSGDPAGYVSFVLPSDAKTLSGNAYDLGSAVTDPATEYAPARRLEVTVVDAASVDESGCFTDGWKVTPELISRGMASLSKVSYGDNWFCLFQATDAGAGNRDAMSYYTLKVGDRHVVFAFDTHYVACATAGIEAPKCVEYDPTRDDTIYPKILETVKPLK